MTKWRGSGCSGGRDGDEVGMTSDESNVIEQK